jgi:hypothetical protein
MGQALAAAVAVAVAASASSAAVGRKLWLLLLLLRVLGPCLIRFIDFRTQQCSPANKKTRSGTSTHLSEQRRCCSADGGLAAHLISSHMPLLRSKLRSVTVGEDHVITSFASNLLEPQVTSRKAAR